MPGRLNHDAEASLTLVAGDYDYYEGPLTAPSTVKGKPCSVSKLYLRWYADPPVVLESASAYSGNDNLKTVTLNIPGSGGFTTTTIPLGGNYRIATGLMDDFKFRNTDTNPHTVYILAYGAQIKHKA